MKKLGPLAALLLGVWAAECRAGTPAVMGEAEADNLLRAVASGQTRAAQRLTAGADAGNAWAQHGLCVMHATGVGAEKSPEQALRWCQAASTSRRRA